MLRPSLPGPRDLDSVLVLSFLFQDSTTAVRLPLATLLLAPGSNTCNPRSPAFPVSTYGICGIGRAGRASGFSTITASGSSTEPSARSHFAAHPITPSRGCFRRETAMSISRFTPRFAACLPLHLYCYAPQRSSHLCAPLLKIRTVRHRTTIPRVASPASAIPTAPYPSIPPAPTIG